MSEFFQNKTLKRLLAALCVSEALRVEAPPGRRDGGVTWARLLCGCRVSSSVGGDLRDLRLSCLVGGLDEHGLGQFLAGRHRHLLDLVELLQYTHYQVV